MGRSWPAAWQRASGLALEQFELSGQSRAMHDVVAVHPRDDRTAAFGDSRVQRRDESAPFGREHPYARVGRAIVLERG